MLKQVADAMASLFRLSARTDKDSDEIASLRRDLEDQARNIARLTNELERLRYETCLADQHLQANFANLVLQVEVVLLKHQNPSGVSLSQPVALPPFPSPVGNLRTEIE